MFIILYEVYHDNGTVDQHVFPTQEAAVAYIQSIPLGAKILPQGSDLGASIYEVSPDKLVQVDDWYQIEPYWNLPAEHPLWVQGYEAYKLAEKSRVRL